jgi:phenylacetate-CoA ligase
MNDKIQKNIIYPLVQRYLKENTLEMLPIIKKYDYLSRNQIQEYTFSELKKLIEHAYNTVDYYKELFDKNKIDIRDLKTIRDFEALPVLTKDQLRNNFNLLISKTRYPKVTKAHSGGTMGQSIYVLRDNYSLSMDRAVKGKCIEWHDCSIGDKEFRFWAYPFDKMGQIKCSLIDVILNRKRISPIHMNDKRVMHIVKALNKFKPQIIYGWTTGIYKFSQIATELNIKLDTPSIKLIIPTSEKLHDYQRKIIEGYFNVPVRDEYGCSESGIIAFECPAGMKHIQVENNYLEIINQEKYQNGIGELVVTSLNNYKMPLIRYKIGDLGKLSDEYCTCGRTTPILSDVTGRILDYLLDSNGEVVLSGVFCYICYSIIDKYKAIKDFRVRQQKDGSIIIYFTPSATFKNDFLKIFEKEIRKHVGEKLNVSFLMVEDFCDIDSGKTRYVISEDLRKNDNYET